MGATQSQTATTNENINDVVSINQNTVMRSVATSICSSTVNFNHCSVVHDKTNQKATCITDMSSYQQAQEAQTSSNTLSNELMNQLQQTTQNASLNFTSQQEKVINNLKINMASDIQQSILMDCNVSQSGVNTITCDDSSVSYTTINQDVAVSQTSDCVQDASQSSVATQDLQNTVSNVMSQKVKNALGAICVALAAIACVVGIIFLGPGAELGSISKDMI